MLRHKNVSNLAITVQSLVIVLIVAVALFAGFEYYHEAPPEKVQKSILSRIDFNQNSNFFHQLELRDPARVFGVPEGGFSALKKKFNPEKMISIRPEMAESSKIVSGKFLPITENPFPPSPRNSEFEQKTYLFRTKTSVIITPDGKIIPADIQSEKNISKNTILNIYRSNSMQRYRIIASCGDIKADNLAAAAALKLNAGSGVYSVIWKNMENK